MNEFTSDVDAALREVWLRHRGAVLDDLTALIDRTIEWRDVPSSIGSIADEIRTRAHRISGSLTMVGQGDQVGVLREIERLAIEDKLTAGDAKEAVDRLHDLLDRLRSAH